MIFDKVIGLLAILSGGAILFIIGAGIYQHVTYKCVESHKEKDTCMALIGDVPYYFDCVVDKCDKWVERE